MFPPNRRQTAVLKLIVVNLILLAIVIFWPSGDPNQSVNMAVAKGKQMLDMNLASAPALDVLTAREIASESPDLAASGSLEDLEFVNAVLLTPGEARSWQDAGCSGGDCAHVTFYDHAQGGSVEAVVDLDTAQLVASWSNENARPGGSTWILPRAFEIASADAEVQAILGDIGSADPAMVPMSGWLADGNCRTEWCVDLTFHDPNGSGKVFHVFVNMESSLVERTFYTRGRPDREAVMPSAEGMAFTDDCHEQYGWEVCWEMTAHDGVDFQDATFKGAMIFRSAKIGQVEAWYPSWPGGYRDEIGFSASVPPFGDTVVDDLGDGFEVRQIFTEFTRWPNCICCYRYEEIIRFYEDGTLEFRFVSHGPGCDDLSVYRPFWRIDVDLDDPENDQVWLWDRVEWQEQPLEFEEHPIVDNVSPEGQTLATIDGDLNYRWLMEEQDPLGRDEGYFFLLQFKENEGDGPIVTGPGDTFIPPRQWVDGDDLSGENVVIWHVPLLKTSKSEPWWCMPDPEPDYSPCAAILRAVPGSEFVKLSDEEIAELEEELEEGPLLPEPIVTLAPEPTPRPIEGVEPEEIALNAGCTSCHKIGELGEGHKVGPDLSNIGWNAQGRVEGMSAAAYIQQSITDPNVYLAPECPNGPCMENIMPRDYGQRLSETQQEVLGAFLLAQQAPMPTSPAQNVTSAQPAPEATAQPAEQSSSRLGNDNVTNVRIASILLLSLAFLISLFVYLRGDDAAET